MNKLDFLRYMYNLVCPPNPDSLKLSLADTHHKGIFSLVIAGTEFGNLTRVFIADKKLKPYQVQLHSHRYPIRLTVLKGEVRHYWAVIDQNRRSDSVELSTFKYKSPLNGGSGLEYVKENKYLIRDYILPVGSTIRMNIFDLHTMSCSKGSIWIVEEQGFLTDSSRVLGVPFITDGLYNEPKPFQVNDKVQLLQKEIKKLMLDYELVSKPKQEGLEVKQQYAAPTIGKVHMDVGLNFFDEEIKKGHE